MSRAANGVALPAATFREGNWHHPDGGRIVGWHIPAAAVERMGADAYHLPREVADALARLAAAHGVAPTEAPSTYPAGKIARAKLVMRAVDDYQERPTGQNRGEIRRLLMDLLPDGVKGPHDAKR